MRISIGMAGPLLSIIGCNAIASSIILPPYPKGFSKSQLIPDMPVFDSLQHELFCLIKSHSLVESITPNEMFVKRLKGAASSGRSLLAGSACSTL
jgi:hypothetical protein